jgi:hypothetical protein
MCSIYCLVDKARKHCEGVYPFTFVFSINVRKSMPPLCLQIVFPLEKSIIVGTERILNRAANSWFLSTSNFKTLNSEPFLCFNWSRIGDMALHGPHHIA